MVDAADVAGDDNPEGNPIPKAAVPPMTLDQAEMIAAEFRKKLGLPPVEMAVVEIAKAAASGGDQQTQIGKMKRIRIMLNPNDDIPPTGLFLGLNGSSYLIRTGVWVDVPLPIVEILDNAVKQIPDVDPLTRRVVGWRPSLRFSYTVAPGVGDRGYKPPLAA